MNGLIQSQMPEELPPEAMPPEGMPPEAMPPEAPPEEPQGEIGDGPPEDLTPEEEDAYERFMLAAQRVLFDSGYADDVVSTLKKDGTVEALADLTYDLVASLDQKSKGLLPDELIAPIAFDILGEIVEIAKAAGATISGREIASAAKAMISRYFTENGATPEEIEATLGGVDADALGAELDKGEQPDQPEQPPEEPPPGIVSGEMEAQP